MKKWLALLLITLCLPGCIVPVVVGAATAGGAVVYDKRSVKTMGEDQQAYQYAQQMLNRDKQIDDYCHVVVAVFNNVGLLVGQAPTPELRQRAYDIVSKVPYINRIYNEITISGPTSFAQRSSDSWITTKVRSALLTKPGLSSNNIKVITESGVVYLMGNVELSQGKLAADAARHVKGVVKVVKVFTYD